MSARTSFPFPKPIAQNSLLKHQQPPLLFSPKREVQCSRSVERLCKSTTTSSKSRHFAVVKCGGRQIVQGEVRSEGQFDDGYYMRRCVELAKKAIGCTSPNPMVGCVIVKDGQVVGEGYHPKAGQPHAEVFALRDAGNKAENGTAYVSLEPCNHYGRTPPCTEALINAKVRKVVVGMVDPNPIVASTGLKKLRDAGIEVTVRVEEEMCKRLNEAYIHRMLTGKPFVTLRYSMSLNGHLLDRLGEEATMIGGYYSKLLQEYDAIILSSKALSDTPSLPMSREPGANEPLRIVLLNNQTSLTSIPALSSGEASNVLIVTEKDRSLEAQIDEEGIQILSLDRISLSAILEHCHSLGFCSVLLDFIGEDLDYHDLLKEGFEENLFRKVIVEVLPLLGGRGDNLLNHTDLNAKVKNLQSSVVGKSFVLEGYF